MNIEAMAPPEPERYPASANDNQAQYTADQMREFAALVRAEAMREAAGICAKLYQPYDDWGDGDFFSAAILAAIDQPKEK